MDVQDCCPMQGAKDRAKLEWTVSAIMNSSGAHASLDDSWVLLHGFALELLVSGTEWEMLGKDRQIQTIFASYASMRRLDFAGYWSRKIQMCGGYQ